MLEPIKQEKDNSFHLKKNPNLNVISDMGVSYKNEVKNKTETMSEKKQVVSILRYTLILQIIKLAYFFTSSDDALIILFL